MLNPEDILVVVDRVEDDVYEGKPFKRIITFAGEDYKIGRNLESKCPLLAHGVCLRLVMGTYKGNPYVDKLDRCLDLTEEKKQELMQPAPKSPKDASIERQTAVKCVCEMLAAGAEVPEDIKDATLEWLRNALK